MEGFQLDSSKDCEILFAQNPEQELLIIQEVELGVRRF